MNDILYENTKYICSHLIQVSLSFQYLVFFKFWVYFDNITIIEKLLAKKILRFVKTVYRPNTSILIDDFFFALAINSFKSERANLSSQQNVMVDF